MFKPPPNVVGLTLPLANDATSAHLIQIVKMLVESGAHFEVVSADATFGVRSHVSLELATKP